MNMLKTHRKEPYIIDGNSFYTVKQFSILINRTEQSVRTLIHKGNKIRKLKHIKIGDKLFVYASEYKEFPFTSCGPTGEVYHYNEKGEIIIQNDIQD